MDRRQTVSILEAPYVSAGRGRRSSSRLIRRVSLGRSSCTSPSAADWTPAKRSPTPLQRAAGRRWRDVNNFWTGFPAASTSHISSDGTTELPGVPVSPLLFPPVPPDLSASVFSPSLCQTGRLSPSRHSRRRLAAAFISAGLGHPPQRRGRSRRQVMERVSSSCRDGADTLLVPPEVPMWQRLGRLGMCERRCRG